MKSTKYSKKVIDHFRNPRNVGTLEGDDVAVGRVGNPVCGDLMDIYIRIKDNIITEIKFKTFGCGAAVATSSMITELAKGKTLEEALQITRNDVANELDGLPPIKMHCSNLAAEGLHAAIKNYREGIKSVPQNQIEEGCTDEPKEIIGVEEFLDKGVYLKYDNLEEFRGKRVLVVENGEKSIELALKLTEVTGRVIFATPIKYILAEDSLKKRLKKSDVKVLLESKLLEVSGTNTVEKVKIYDLNENDEYELSLDAVILP